jgi:hypothetical protein
MYKKLTVYVVFHVLMLINFKNKKSALFREKQYNCKESSNSGVCKRRKHSDKF